MGETLLEAPFVVHHTLAPARSVINLSRGCLHSSALVRAENSVNDDAAFEVESATALFAALTLWE